MTEYKNCKQCGELKPQEQYRKYYGGRKGTYNTCKLCEKINSREKYLSNKESLTETEQTELDKIHALWEYQVTLGLRPPRHESGKSTPLSESLDDLVDKFASRAKALDDVHVTTVNAPADLVKWLTEELTEEPDYYLDEVYEALVVKYRPQLYINSETMLPVHDDTHRDILQQILERFNDYEDKYYD